MNRLNHPPSNTRVRSERASEDSQKRIRTNMNTITSSRFQHVTVKKACLPVQKNNHQTHGHTHRSNTGLRHFRHAGAPASCAAKRLALATRQQHLGGNARP